MRYSSSACPWPAEAAADGTNLTEIAGDLQCYFGYPLQENDFSGNLSGASWNPVSRTLWLVKNGPGTLFAVVEDGDGFRFAEQNGVEANWEIPGIGDVEGVTQVSFDEAHIVYVIDEGGGKIRRYDTSNFSDVKQTHVWGPLPGIGREGGEGLAFVPDMFLAAQGFVDANGVLYTSKKGMGGLMFVGHQSDGDLHVYDVNPDESNDYVYVGRYKTGGYESAGLEFDRSAGVLHIWHDSDIDELEIVSLSSSEAGGKRVMSTITTYSGPDLTLEMSSTLEGFALVPLDECVDGKRRAWLVTDGGDTVAYHNAFMSPADRTRAANQSYRSLSNMTVVRNELQVVGDSTFNADRAYGQASSTDTDTSRFSKRNTAPSSVISCSRRLPSRSPSSRRVPLTTMALRSASSA